MKHSKARLAVLGGAFAAALTGGVAWATIPNAAGEINGCYRTSLGDERGQLRVVDDAASCRSNETAIRWSQEGPRGATGAAGVQGVKGETGATGATGAQGPKGEKGDTGDSGPVGETGAPGPAGPKGETGATGAKGDEGETGATGAPGATGVAGEPGPKGDRGEPGTNGTNGLDGNTGPVGPPGLSGVEHVSLVSSVPTGPFDPTLAARTASCTGSRKVISGGFSTVDLVVYASYPAPGGTGWTVEVVNKAFLPGLSSLRVFAVCAFVD